MQVIFGDHVTRPETAEAGTWIASACRGRPGTVGSLVPAEYAAVLRVFPPDPDLDDWWAAYRSLYESIAVVGDRHTRSADRAWFAVWDGHGIENSTMRVAWRDPPSDDEERLAREQERSRLRVESDRRNASIGAALSEIPRFVLPFRTYYLLEGPVSAVTLLRDPAQEDQWRNPDLFWPDDRSWFVATDVDFWSLYLGGDRHFIDRVASSVATPTQIVTFEYTLETEH